MKTDYSSRETNYNHESDNPKERNLSYNVQNPMENKFSERLSRLTARVGGESAVNDHLEPEPKNPYLEKLKRDLSLATNNHSRESTDNKTFSSSSRQPYLLDKKSDQQRQQINSNKYLQSPTQPTNRSNINPDDKFGDIKNDARQNSIYRHETPNFRGNLLSGKDVKLDAHDKDPHYTNDYNELHQTSSEYGKHMPTQSVPPTRSYNETRSREYQHQRPHWDLAKQYEEPYDGYATENYAYQNQPHSYSPQGLRDSVSNDHRLAEKTQRQIYCDQPKGVQDPKHLENPPQKYHYRQWEKHCEARSGLQDISKQPQQNSRSYSNNDDKRCLMRDTRNSGLSDRTDNACRDKPQHPDYYPSFDPYLVRQDDSPQSNHCEYTHKDRVSNRQPYYMGDMPGKLEPQGRTYGAASPHYEYEKQAFENTTDRSKTSGGAYKDRPPQRPERHYDYNEPQLQYQHAKELDKKPVLPISATVPNTYSYHVPSPQTKRTVDENNYNVPYAVDNTYSKLHCEEPSAARGQYQSAKSIYNGNTPRSTVPPFYKRNGLQDHRQAAGVAGGSGGMSKNSTPARVKNCDASYVPSRGYSNGLTAPQTSPQEWEQYQKH